MEIFPHYLDTTSFFSLIDFRFLSTMSYTEKALNMAVILSKVLLLFSISIVKKNLYIFRTIKCIAAFVVQLKFIFYAIEIIHSIVRTKTSNDSYKKRYPLSACLSREDAYQHYTVTNNSKVDDKLGLRFRDSARRREFLNPFPYVLYRGVQTTFKRLIC